MLESPLNQRVQRSYINFQRFKILKIFKKEYADSNNWKLYHGPEIMYSLGLKKKTQSSTST